MNICWPIFSVCGSSEGRVGIAGRSGTAAASCRKYLRTKVGNDLMHTHTQAAESRRQKAGIKLAKPKLAKQDPSPPTHTHTVTLTLTQKG